MMIIWWSSLWKTVTTCLPPLQLYCGEGYCSSPPTPPGKSFFHQGINNSYILISRLMPVIILNMFATTWVGSGFASNWTTRVYSDPGQNPGSQTDTCAMVVSRHSLRTAQYVTKGRLHKKNGYIGTWRLPSCFPLLLLLHWGGEGSRFLRPHSSTWSWWWEEEDTVVVIVVVAVVVNIVIVILVLITIIKCKLICAISLCIAQSVFDSRKV